LHTELLSYRFEATLTEKKAVIAAILNLCQQLRITLYYGISRYMKKVQSIGLYYF
jgi:hypothetical protein